MTSNPKAPAYLAGCGCLSLLFAAALFLASAFLAGDSSSDETKSAAARTDLTTYTNTRDGRTGNLAQNYVDFRFDYPKSWTAKADPEGVNFITVERTQDSRTLENLNIGYFQTAGSTSGTEALYGQLMASLQAQFTQQFPDLQKVHEGKTKVAMYDAYEGLFEATVQADGKPVKVYTRVILLPTPDGARGVSLVMMGTSFHPELQGPADLGTKGELPIALSSFRFAN